MARYMYVKKPPAKARLGFFIKRKPRGVKIRNHRKKFNLNYGSVFLFFIGGFFIIIAISPLINYYIDQNIFHEYQKKIVNSDPNAQYFSKIIDATNIKHNSTYNGYFHLSIPSINLENVPVKAGVDGFNTAAYEKVLVNSVAQMKGTALPGEVGNVYIYGHSAPQWFADLYPNSFLGIFTNILNLKPGNKIYTQFMGKEYVYKVIKTTVVSPTDVSVLESPKGQRYLTLMTCIPPGIGTQRFIVTAVLEK